MSEGIKTSGEWISAAELEDLICAHEAVSEAAVTTVRDERYGEKPIALIVLKAGFEGRVTELDIRESLCAYVDGGMLPAGAIPDRIAIVDSIPVTGIGKVNRRQLHEKMKEFDLSQEP